MEFSAVAPSIPWFPLRKLIPLKILQVLPHPTFDSSPQMGLPYYVMLALTSHHIDIVRVQSVS